MNLAENGTEVSELVPHQAFGLTSVHTDFGNFVIIF